MKNGIVVALACALAATLAPSPGGGAQAQPALAVPESIRLAPDDGRGPTLELRVFRPAGAQAPVPAIVALHGCGGLFARNGAVGARERAFAAEFTARGYAVVMPDSFTPRGVREVCTLGGDRRPVRVPDRRQDALRVIRWIARGAPGLDGRYALVGWSNGGSTLLATLDAAAWPPDLPAPVASFAFYPGCGGDLARIAASVGTLAMFIAGDDNWTLPGPCIELALRIRTAAGPAELHVFSGAVHGFDAPSSPLRTRTDVPLVRNGARVQVKLGTHPQARAESYRILGETLARRMH